MRDTTLRFLMADGAMSATFSPPLTPEQYEDLYSLVGIPSTKEELRGLLASAARRWGIKVAFDADII